MDIFEKAGLKVVKEETQTNWPKELLEVRIYMIQ
jgi:hypothetical protein